MHDLDLKSLRLFIAACESGNLKLAAEQEHIEPSAVSKRLARLEASCGAPLLIRHRQGARPTPEGQVLLEHARTVLFTMHKAESDLSAFRAGIQGQVRLAASASAIAQSLLDDLAQFMRAPGHERIQIHIEEKFSRDIVQSVRHGLTPLGICWDSIDFEGLTQHPWRSDELVLAVPPRHPLARRASVAFEDTLDDAHVVLSPATAVSSMLHRVALQQGKPLQYRSVVSNFDSAFRIVAAGLGVSVVPRGVGRIYVQNKLVALVKLDNAWAQRRFVVCHRADVELSAAASRLLDFLLAAPATEGTGAKPANTRDAKKSARARAQAR